MVENIIVAIDTVSLSEFEKIFSKVKKIFKWYKIHSIFLKEHKSVCKTLRNESKKIFLDLKFFDIPTTVEKHIDAISGFCDMFTVHLLCGKVCLKRVAEVSRSVGITPVGVTVLTSFSDSDLSEIGINSNVVEQVLRLVELGMNCGIDHFVCSPKEIEIVKKEFADAKLITPGIRITGQRDDQKRTTGPKEAFEKGANFIVMGRDLIRLDDPEDIFLYL
ncbi:MAG: orotidine-5'-phosphate decarboxylase [Brevinematia bacterium]